MSHHVFGPRRPDHDDSQTSRDDADDYDYMRMPEGDGSDDGIWGCIGPLGCLTYWIVGGIVVAIGQLFDGMGLHQRTVDVLTCSTTIALFVLVLFGVAALVGWLP